MVHRRTVLAGGTAAGAVALLGGVTACQSSESSSNSSSTDSDGHVKQATAITEVFGDGQKLIAVAVEYDAAIRNSGLTKKSFKVSGRTVTSVYANRRAELDEQGKGRDGQFVIVELDPDDDAAALWTTDQGSGDSGKKKSASPSASSSKGKPDITVGSNTPGGTVKKAKATVVQKAPVTTRDGKDYPASSTEHTTSKTNNLIVDEFTQHTFHDAETGRKLRYNLFLPEGYSNSKHYPLVLFMTDASVVNVDTVGPLVQGLGAVCWASPEDQKKHPCIVLAPEYDEVVIDDDYKPSDLFDTTYHLVQEISRKYSIDTDRIYSTGQSMGAMLTLGLNIKHPDLLAASFVVAGQWPAKQVKPLAKKKLWVVVSQEDDKAYPGQNAIMKVVKAEGTKVGTASWDAQSSQAQFAADVRSMERQQTPVNYAHFEKGTVTTGIGAGTMAHMATWRYAYSIPGIRDWIMRQKRS
ncbi:hypothetical protein ACIHCV_18930 [Streptomyces sp. NPDC051956]|uniref:hypothetical protein n=1 Tax=Streptomyces sp. NPDC051956 TaxID=3365677 RepID=UPI0037D031A5